MSFNFLEVRGTFKAFLFLLTCLGSGVAMSADYLDGVKDDYDKILVVKIMSAATIFSKESGVCFYSYTARVVEKLRGSFSSPEFKFSADGGLSVGDDYLIYLSEEDAKKYRRLDDENHKSCEKKIYGFYLLYNEIHLIKNVWDEKKYDKFVRFSDPWAKFDDDHSKDETNRLTDFDYVKERLLK